MRIFAAILFSSTIMLAPAIADAQTTTAPAASVAQATAAPTAPTAAPAEAANGGSGANLDEIVCKNQPPATGSRLGGGRECHTVRQWNQREREAQDITRRQEMGTWHPPGGG